MIGLSDTQLLILTYGANYPLWSAMSFDTIACVSVTSSVCSTLSSCDITLPSGFGNSTDVLDMLYQLC